jgi:hypothetical protein
MYQYYCALIIFDFPSIVSIWHWEQLVSVFLYNSSTTISKYQTMVILFTCLEKMRDWWRSLLK